MHHKGKRNSFARTLRRKQTDAEKSLWYKLRNRQIERCKFRRQHPVGPYIADFACVELRLIIELDGGQHAELKSEHDVKRDHFLTANGWCTLRFWNTEVLENMEGVLHAIQLSVKKRLD